MAGEPQNMPEQSKMLEEVEIASVRARQRAPNCPQEPKIFIGLAGVRRRMDPATKEMLKMTKR